MTRSTEKKLIKNNGFPLPSTPGEMPEEKGGGPAVVDGGACGGGGSAALNREKLSLLGQLGTGCLGCYESFVHNYRPRVEHKQFPPPCSLAGAD
jgi:hypothetical protein